VHPTADDASVLTLQAGRKLSFEVAADDELHDAATMSQELGNGSLPENEERSSFNSGISRGFDEERRSFNEERLSFTGERPSFTWPGVEESSRHVWPGAASTMPDLPLFDEKMLSMDDDETTSMPDLMQEPPDDDEGGMRVCVGKYCRDAMDGPTPDGDAGSSFSTQASSAGVLPPLAENRPQHDPEVQDLMCEFVSDRRATQNQNVLMEFALRSRPAPPQGRSPHFRRLRGVRKAGV